MNVLIMGDTDPFILSLIRSLVSKQVNCHVFDRGRMWSVRLSRHCRGYVNAAALPEDQLIGRLNGYCLEHGVSVIIPGDYRAAAILLKARERLAPGLSLFPGASLDTLELLNNKDSFTRLLDKAGLPQPRTVIVDDMAQLTALDVSFPCLVKSARCEGGSFERYLKNDRASFLESGRSIEEFPLLVQEFIPGSDVCLGILARQGKVAAWTMYEYVAPFRFRFFASDELLGLGQKAVAAAGYEGVACFDLRRDSRDGSFRFIECNPRFWNSMYASTCVGVNFAARGLGLEEGAGGIEKGYEGEEYMFPFIAVRKTLSGKLKWKDVPRLTKKDLADQMSDPLSLAYLVFLW